MREEIIHMLESISGSAQTFAVIDRVDVGGLQKLDEFNKTEGVACNGASLLEILALDMAANAFASKFNVLEAVVQNLVYAAGGGGERKCQI